MIKAPFTAVFTTVLPQWKPAATIPFSSGAAALAG
jgi:hypothetical protein